MKKVLLSLIFICLSNISFGQVAGHVVIAEIYGGGGNGGASLRNDYIVLYNPTDTNTTLTNWSIQHQRTGSTLWEIQTLWGTINSKSYYFIQYRNAGSNGDTLLTGPNLISVNSLAATSGMLALVKNTDAITDPFLDGDVIDFVGYGVTDTFNVVPAAAPSNTSSIRRRSDTGDSTYNVNGSGYDSGNDSADFFVETDLILNPPANQSAKATHPVIAEVYTTGGNPGAKYANDFVVLYNPTGSNVDLSTWSIQRENLNGSEPWRRGNLTGNISADGYYLILGRSAGSSGDPLPFPPDVTIDSLNLSATAGKIALADSQATFTNINNSHIIDFLGYGTANQFEGLGTAPRPDTMQTLRRRDNIGLRSEFSNGHGWDTDNNQTDFYLINNPSTPLPVELTSFIGEVAGKSIKLSWKTETEVQNYGFEIERKSSAESWHKLGFVEGHGSSNTPWEYSFTDSKVQPGKYTYRLKQIDTDGKYEYSGTVDVNFGSLDVYKLNQNYPNPFNPVTSISFNLPAAANVKLVIYNMLGQKVKTLVNGHTEAGFHQVSFDASELSSGVYIYRLDTDSFSKVRKMLLLK